MMRPLYLSFLTFMLLVFQPVCLALATPVRDHQIVAEDYFDLAVLGNLAASPDGSQVAYTESLWGRGKEGRSSDLWVVGRDGRNRQRLTFDGFGGGALAGLPTARLSTSWAAIPPAAKRPRAMVPARSGVFLPAVASRSLSPATPTASGPF